MDLKTVNVKLPLVGSTKIHFYRDSCIFWEFSDDKESSRLNRIPHLGIASTAFTGANHSRLEYTLLQCAIIELVSKFHKDSSKVALSGRVKLNGLRTKASSGEDLLKLWALLGSYGHAQWTFGTERILLQLAYEDSKIKNWLLKRIRNIELRQWSQNVIKNYSDELFHYVLAIKRIYLEKPYNHDKTKLLHYLRNFLLPIDNLFKNDLTARYKLYSLRKIYKRIRLISIIALDSYYSHYPINIQLNPIITDPDFISPSKYEFSDISDQIESVVGWLADELHFSHEATALQRFYEKSYYNVLKKTIKESKENESKDRFNEFCVFMSIINYGVGKPENNQIIPLFRAKFKNLENGLFGYSNKYELQKTIEKLIDNKNILASVEQNPYQETLNIDLHYKPKTNLYIIGRALLSLQSWVIRQIKIDINKMLKSFGSLPDHSLSVIKNRQLRLRIDSHSHLFEKLFCSIIKLLIPQSWNFVITDFIPGNDKNSPILFKYKIDDEIIIDNLTPLLKNIIDQNPYNFHSDRLQEIKGLKRIVDYSRAQLTIACPEKFKLTGNHGRDKDDWDGVIVQLDDKYLRLIIIEAKNITGSDNKRENAAFDQLKDTIDILSSKFKPRYQRKRIKGIGARLVIKITEKTT